MQQTMQRSTRDLGRRLLATGALAAIATTAQASVVMSATRYVYPFMLAGWRIRGHLRNDVGDIWTRASNYHSRTPRFNASYRVDLIRRATRWADWLDHHFPTHDAVVVVAP
jgi:hypothetical protein